MAGNTQGGSSTLTSTEDQYGEPLTLGLELTPEDKKETKESFLVAHPENKNPCRYLFHLIKGGWFAQMEAPQHVFTEMETTMATGTPWQEQLSLFAMQLLNFLRSPMAKLGRIIELVGNTTVANGGLLRTLIRFSCSSLFLFQNGPLIVPAQDSVNYRTAIGLLDPRAHLINGDINSASGHTDTNEDVDAATSTRNDIFPGQDNGDRRIADLMIMAAKFAYENENLVRNVVTRSWNMNYVGQYECWNEFQKRSKRQVLIFTDKVKDANAVVVAFRGTAPFDADDWSTDLDFSWYDLEEGIGKVHVGFLEALGLGDRTEMNTFAQIRRNAHDKEQNSSNDPATAPAASGLPQVVIDDNDKTLAFDHTTTVVKQLLEANQNAKLFVTGHSLGGAMALLYVGMLYYFKEQSVADRIGALYTFGQPRVGDKQFANYMRKKFSVQRYYRVVYSSDIVPRVPFDNCFFQFTHWGLCFYFNSCYEEQTLKEEPNPNYFTWDLVSTRLHAVYDLVISRFRRCKYGPEYQESAVSFLFRVLGVFLPGLGAHSPVNYVNALRLGEPVPLIPELSSNICPPLKLKAS